MTKPYPRAGFSLPELTIVIAITAILATIGSQAYKTQVTRAKRNEAKAELTAVYTAEKAFFVEFKRYWVALQCVGYRPTGKLNYRIGYNAGASAGDLNKVIPSYPTTAAALACRNGGVSTATLCVAIGTCTAETPAAAVANWCVGTDTTFTACARGNIDDDPALDALSLNENAAMIFGVDDSTQ